MFLCVNVEYGIHIRQSYESNGRARSVLSFALQVGSGRVTCVLPAVPIPGSSGSALCWFLCSRCLSFRGQEHRISPQDGWFKLWVLRFKVDI